MIVSEYSTDEYKSRKINIGAMIKIPKTLKFIPDRMHICKYDVKKLLFVIRFVADPFQNVFNTLTLILIFWKTKTFFKKP